MKTKLLCEDSIKETVYKIQQKQPLKNLSPITKLQQLWVWFI